MEIQEYCGKCKCNKQLDMRITDVKNKDKIAAWIIYGFCKKCHIVYFQGLFIQADKPLLDRDFSINYNNVVKGVKDAGPI